MLAVTELPISKNADNIATTCRNLYVAIWYLEVGSDKTLDFGLDTGFNELLYSKLGTYV